MYAVLYIKGRKTAKTDKPQLISLIIKTRQQYVRCVCINSVIPQIFNNRSTMWPVL